MAGRGRPYVFDAYGTLFDVHAPAARLAREIGAPHDRLSEIWRTKQLEYTWVHAATGVPATFWELTVRALDYAIEATGARLGDEVRARLLDAYRDLAAYPEVLAVLSRLKGRGDRLAILSNGDPEMLERAIASAGLDGLFDAALSVQAVGTYKPHAVVYRLAVEAFDAAPGDMTFCSSNRWDVAGASAFGFDTVWVNRQSRPEEYPAMKAGRTIRDLSGLDVVAPHARA